MDTIDLVISISGLVASIATALGVIAAAVQIRLAKQQSTTQFEDELAREYREIAQEIPVEALLGEHLLEEQYRLELTNFYRYIDLSNTQVFLRQNGRIGGKTWENWRDGIKGNLSLPAFKKAWEEIKQRAPNSFEELRQLENSEFSADPLNWN